MDGAGLAPPLASRCYAKLNLSPYCSCLEHQHEEGIAPLFFQNFKLRLTKQGRPNVFIQRVKTKNVTVDKGQKQNFCEILHIFSFFSTSNIFYMSNASNSLIRLTLYCQIGPYGGSTLGNSDLKLNKSRNV